MEPQIKYARTEDGVNIAYYTLGSGPPLIWLSMPAGHTTAEWKIPPLRASIEAASRFFTVVRIDPRGFGLSDRHATDISFRSMARDFKAVSDKESLGPAIVLGLALAAPPAVYFASAYPDRVSRLVLLGVSPGLYRNARLTALSDLSLVDWDLAADTIMRSFWPESPQESDAFGNLLRESVDPQTLHDLVYDTEKDFDIRPELTGLSMPTLVLHDRSNQNHPIEESKQAAALIPQGRFVEIDNSWRIAPAVARFLSETGLETRAAGLVVTSRAKPYGPAASGTAIILFADIVDSTALTERLGDAGFRGKARDLDATLRSVIRENAGTPIEGKLLGDGVLATFTSASQAIGAARACASAGDAAGLPLHLGLHAGDVIREDDNVFGGAVNIAARISGLSAPGEVLVSQTVRDLARTSAGVSFEDRSEQALKGVGEPVRIWAVSPSTDSGRTGQ